MKNWKDKIQVKKGFYGEKIVRNYLEDRGWIIYIPYTNGPHAFDHLCVKDKRRIIIAEVKTKARMNKWNATGFNVKNYNEYLFIQNKYRIEIFIFFVDEYLKSIYGNKLSILKKPYRAKDGKYPMIIKNIILFSLEVMKTISKISDEDSLYLKRHSSRHYDYTPYLFSSF